MSYSLTLQCGCVIHVRPECKPAPVRIVQSRGPRCRATGHAIGRRLYLWEMLPPIKRKRIDIFDSNIVRTA